MTQWLPEPTDIYADDAVTNYAVTNYQALPNGHGSGWQPNGHGNGANIGSSGRHPGGGGGSSGGSGGLEGYR